MFKLAKERHEKRKKKQQKQKIGKHKHPVNVGIRYFYIFGYHFENVTKELFIFQIFDKMAIKLKSQSNNYLEFVFNK